MRERLYIEIVFGVKLNKRNDKVWIGRMRRRIYNERLKKLELAKIFHENEMLGLKSWTRPKDMIEVLFDEAG